MHKGEVAAGHREFDAWNGAHCVIFARGLLAGGWAALYCATYAMQALEAARIIHNPLLGVTLQLAVATARHSSGPCVENAGRAQSPSIGKPPRQWRHTCYLAVQHSRRLRGTN